MVTVLATLRYGIKTNNHRIVFTLAITLSILFVFTSFRGRPLLLQNGHFLTLNADNAVAQSIFIDNSRIVAIGNDQWVSQWAESELSQKPLFERALGYRVRDLQGRTVVPGFIDAHSHFPSSGLASAGLDLSSPPIGTIATTQQLLEAIQSAAKRQSETRWIVGLNYDDASLLEGQHPTRQQLDEVAPNHAVYLWHRSGHMGIANTRALLDLGYDPVTGKRGFTNVSDGHVGIGPDGKPSGLLQEHAAPGLSRLIKEIPWWKLPGVLIDARDEYLRAGVTTAQNGYADTTLMRLLLWAQRLGIIPQRLVIWLAHDKLDAPVDLPAGWIGSDRHLRSALPESIGWSDTESEQFTVAAIKLVADGSPQGRTAWLSKPYLPDASLGVDYAGLPTQSEAGFHNLIERYHKAGYQLAIHGNGDAAIESIIKALKKAQSDFPRTDMRHTLVHAQTIRADQLDKVAALGVGISFFPTHTFYWGDWYRKRVLGEQRAAQISPLAAAEKAGIRFSIHTDAPVTPMLPMQMLWSANRRETRSGFTLGFDQIISREKALRAMTIDAAWQSHLENSRGSLEVGKLADLVVLSANPLVIEDPRLVHVERVYIGGVTQRPWQARADK